MGYGRYPPPAQWPKQARIALQFLLNYEEGAENSVLHGDAGAEQFLFEMFNPPRVPERHLSLESMSEYGSRAGVWYILREFEKRQLPITVFGVGMALQRHPDVTAAFVELGYEIACHGSDYYGDDLPFWTNVARRLKIFSFTCLTALMRCMPKGLTLQKCSVLACTAAC